MNLQNLSKIYGNWEKNIAHAPTFKKLPVPFILDHNTYITKENVYAL